MQSNNMRQEQQNMSRQSAILVSTLGFGTAIDEKLRQLFQPGQIGKPTYALVQATEPGINILLVNYDNPLALRKKDILLNSVCPSAEVVAVSQKPLNNPPLYHIRGMLTASRLLAVLDKIPPTQTATPLTPQDITPPSKLELVQLPTISPGHPAASRNISATPAQVGQYRALVVDDSAAIQKSIQLKLATLEQIADIDFADSGEAALAMAAANHYHLIFLDVMMPGMDGYEACALLRKQPEYKKTPIIMVSGKTSPLDEVKGVMAGCTTYLTKPVQAEAFQKLSTRVLAWLSDRKADGQNAR
ncbi:MAG: response regulator [Methylovulum sp.]|nr:response regulator [Methylovulum sp.]